MPNAEPGRMNVWVRGGLLAVGVGGLIYGGGEAWLLYTDSAPFHQMYSDATAAQDEAVTCRMAAALLGLPVALITLGAGLGGPSMARRPRLWLGVLACVLLLNSLQSCGIHPSLPYGFGSGYEHASPAQRGHMTLASRVGVVGLLLAAVALVASRRSAPRSHVVVQEPCIR